MMNSQTYVSDPRIWEAFYKNMAEKKFSPYKYKPKQIGRGTKRHRSYVIPLRPHSQLESPENSTHVTPVAAVEERAKTEHANDVKEGVPFVKVLGGSIKRPRSRSSFISAKKRKTTTRLNQRKKKKKSFTKPVKQQKKKLTKKKLITKNQRKPAKKTKSTKQKKLKIDAFKSVFKA